MLQIRHVESGRRDLALRLLFARFPPHEQETRLRDTLLAAERGSLNLDGLLLAEEDGKPVGAALSMIQADGIALVWPPVITCQSGDAGETENALMQQICRDIDRAGAKLAQCLIAPDDAFEGDLLKQFGFCDSTEMFFLARQLTPNDKACVALDEDLDHDLFDAKNADRFASVVERTYMGSLDCAFLNDVRNGRDAISSHQLSGSFDPAGWRLYRLGSQDVGVLMMNEHPDQDAIEIVYFGIVPEFRGRGLGRKLLAHGIQAAALTNRAVMFLGVDCANTYANALYSEFNFAELARRQVLVRRQTSLAQK